MVNKANLFMVDGISFFLKPILLTPTSGIGLMTRDIFNIISNWQRGYKSRSADIISIKLVIFNDNTTNRLTLIPWFLFIFFNPILNHLDKSRIIILINKVTTVFKYF